MSSTSPDLKCLRAALLFLGVALIASATATEAVKISSSSTDAEDTVLLTKAIKAKRFPDLTVTWIFAPEFDDYAKKLEPSVLFCDVQLFKKGEFVNGVRVTFDIGLIVDGEVARSLVETETTSSFGQASFQIEREEIALDEIGQAQVRSTLKGKKRVDKVSLECTSRSRK